MLAASWQAEVAAYVEQFADQRDDNGRRPVLSLDVVELRMHQANCVRHLRDCSDEGCPCSTTVRLSVFMLRSLNILCEVLCQPTGSRRMTGNFLEVLFWYS